LGVVLDAIVDVERQLRNCVDAIAAGQDFRMLREKIVALEAELAAIEKSLFKMADKSVRLQVRDTRQFVTKRLSDLRAIFEQDVSIAREELAKHVTKITLKVENGRYVAEGLWDWLRPRRNYGAGGQTCTILPKAKFFADLAA
jgi:hypothetical protein